jgi:molybdate transport system ATP-binding protein
LIVLENATIARAGGEPILRELSWTVRDGETWAVIGPTAAGKTTLAETLTGRNRVVAGSIEWPIVQLAGAKYPHEVVHLVSFREESRLFNYAGSYYQQRFEFADAEHPLSLGDYLRSRVTVSDDAVRRMAERFGIAEQLSLAMMKLSNGQTRRARIARELLLHPPLLILDDPFVGIDAEGRESLVNLLGEFVSAGQRMILVVRPEQVPAWVTHRLELGESTTDAEPRLIAEPSEQPPGPPIVELNNVTVRHGGKPILQDVSWTVRGGERWALVGPNGAGKTTLLALACGDHPQAFSNDVKLFGKPRGSGETIWDVKRRVGFVSPEFHLYFSEPLSAFEAAATGFHDALLYREASAAEAEHVKELFETFGATAILLRQFRQLSTGQQRLVLLIRALVKRPPLLILDEPFQGLDARTANRIRAWLDEHLTPEQTLIFVTHLTDEIPRTVTRTLQLKAGRRAGPPSP